MSKRNLNLAFSSLRKLGYFAKQNFLCCNSCVWADIPDELSEKVVFYHRQDFLSLKKTGECYLTWSGDGDLIKKTLQDSGVICEWSGSEKDRILVRLNSK